MHCGNGFDAGVVFLFWGTCIMADRVTLTLLGEVTQRIGSL